MALYFSPYSSRQRKPSTRIRRLLPDLPLRDLRRLLCGILFVYLFLAAPPFRRISLGAGSPQVTRDQLKAVHLYNFLQFVTWPKNPSQTEQDTSKLICLVDDININDSLEELRSNLITKKKAPFRIKHYEKYEEGMNYGACQILFISASEKNHFEEIISSLKHVPTLTVSDSLDFKSAGGMIFLTDDQNRLRYLINRKQSTAAGLRFSSQLLKSAIEVTNE